MNADGSGARRLTNEKGNDAAPSWSPDGERIAFQSDRNFPDGRHPELYSVRPDGSCLTWLTNGVPDSAEPAWRPAPSGTSDPGGCGDRGLAPTNELDVSAALAFKRFPLYWLGTTAPGGLLLGEASKEAGSFYFDYNDCGAFEPGACPESVQLDEEPSCRLDRYEPDLEYADLTRRRGALVATYGFEAETSVSVYAGPTAVSIWAGGRERALALVDALSGLHGSPGAGAPLPPTALPNRVWRRLGRARRAVRRHGIHRGAKALGISSRLLRRRLRLTRNLKKLGVTRRMRC
jgi:hypothetical protein